MLDLLYFDTDIAVCVKPAGVLSEGDDGNSMPHLLSLVLKERGYTAPSPYVVHRLDRETEGIMVFALNSSSAAALSLSAQNGDMQKIYHALCVGSLEPDSGVLCDLLFYDRSRGKSFVVDRERKGVKKASLEYTVLRRYADRTLISVELHTGRTHQIRVQFASRGHALCGDRRYGASADYGNRLCLCATSLSFTHPKTKERIKFEIENPYK